MTSRASCHFIISIITTMPRTYAPDHSRSTTDHAISSESLPTSETIRAIM